MAKTLNELLEIITATEESSMPEIYPDEKFDHIKKHKKKDILEIETGPCTVWMAYIDNCNHPIAISNIKELVKGYMENNRFVKPSNYYLEKHIIPEEILFLNYDDYCISEFRGNYIPNIDITMIKCNERSIDSMLSNTILNLKDIAILSKDISDLNNYDKKTLIEAAKVLSKINKNDKMLSELQQADFLTNSILYCNIKEYLTHVKIYKEWKENIRSMNYQIYKD